MKHASLFGVATLVVEKVDGHRKLSFLAAAFLFVEGYAGVESYAVNPRFDVATVVERV